MEQDFSSLEYSSEKNIPTQELVCLQIYISKETKDVYVYMNSIIYFDSIS